MDSQVKVRGFRIELGEIESVLNDHDSISRAAVNVWEAGPGDQRLVAYVVLLLDQPLATTALRKHLLSKLPDYMVPQHYVELDKIPLTPNGKVDRNQLHAPKVVTGGEGDDPPQTSGEILMAGIWSRLLVLDNIGRNDNFFELGGHSLLAVRVVAELEKLAGVPIKLRHIVLDDLQQISKLIGGASTDNLVGKDTGESGFFRRLLWRSA